MCGGIRIVSKRADGLAAGVIKEHRGLALCAIGGIYAV